MAYDVTHGLSAEFDTDARRTVAASWIAFLRVVTGWWFLHAGVTKLITDGLSYGYGPVYLRDMGGTVLGPLAVRMGTDLAPFIEAVVPLAETLIGLGLIAGALVRLASFFGAVFMAFFWVGNADFAHGVVSGDLMGLLLFGTMIALAAGRHYGLDARLERTRLVTEHPRLRYLLG